MSLNSDSHVEARPDLGAGPGAPEGDSVIVPASVANLGGGFDTLGVAVQLYLRARIVDLRDDGGTRLEVVRSAPPVRGQNAVERGFAAAARRSGRDAPSVRIEVTSEIPMAAGLGSSAAATVAGLRLFERVTGTLDDGTLLGAAIEAEGHGDNAAPALFGGLNSVVDSVGGEPLALRWSWPEDLRLVVVTPAIGLATAKARAALPKEVTRTDAIFNLQRVLALVHALQHVVHLARNLAVNAVEDQLGIAKDRVQWRAQLVAHIGEKL